MDQYIGKLLDNRYEIMEQIGMGGMARVFRALDHRLNRQVAVKILREDLAEDAELRRRFHEESQAVAMLSHPNIVAVYDVSRSSDLEYIVMELIDGITLKQYMQKKGNKLNWREALHFITQIVKALGHAHSRGIIHRDIKPHNIMVLRDGSVKVADFGIARVASGGHSTLTQEALGSVHYISPEQARGSHIDARSDLYSAGVVLYEMITGRLPFEGDTPVSVAIQHINSIPLSPREIDPAIPEALEAITMKAMAPDPDNRYLSADDMLADLEEFRKNPNINFDYNVSGFQDDEDDVDKTQVLPTAASISRVGNRNREPERAQNRGRSNPPPRYREREEDEEDDVIKVAIIGKPNVGKSSLVNRILGEERVIVSDMAGTTRDAIDSYFENEKGKFCFIDTAGMRKKSKVDDRIEKFSVLRSTMAIERSDVCLILIDAQEGVTEQDTKVAGLAHEAGKACIIVVNKWDAIEKDGKTMDKMRQEVMRDLSYMTYAPIVFISALTGQRVDRLFDLIVYVNNQAAMRITTGMLNSVLADATARVQPPTDKGRRLKIYYMTQVGIKPPHFVCFCNDARLFHFSYQRYLENQIRATFGLEGTPVRLTIRQKGEKEG